MKVGDLIRATADFKIYDIVCIGVLVELNVLLVKLTDREDQIYKVHRILYEGEIREFETMGCWHFEVINESR